MKSPDTMSWIHTPIPNGYAIAQMTQQACDTFRHEISLALSASAHPFEWMQPMELEKVDASNAASGAYFRDVIPIQIEKRHWAIFSARPLNPRFHDELGRVAGVDDAMGEIVAKVFQTLAAEKIWIRFRLRIGIRVEIMEHSLVILDENRECSAHITSITQRIVFEACEPILETTMANPFRDLVHGFGSGFVWMRDRAADRCPVQSEKCHAIEGVTDTSETIDIHRSEYWIPPGSRLQDLDPDLNGNLVDWIIRIFGFRIRGWIQTSPLGGGAQGHRHSSVSATWSSVAGKVKIHL
jgi:hypothetical protein